jgi:hypothetical protein
VQEEEAVVIVHIYLWKKKGEPRIYMSHLPPDNDQRKTLRDGGFTIYKAFVPIPDEPDESPTHDKITVAEAQIDDG